MPTLIYACPFTRKLISSGLFVDAATMAKISHVPITLPCPCGSSHTFEMRDGKPEVPSMSGFVLPPHLRPNLISG